MDILRVPSFAGSVSIDVPEPLTEYDFVIEDLTDGSTISSSNTSSPTGVLQVQIPTTHDTDLRIFVDHGEVEDTYLTITRPYVDPNTIDGVETASDVKKYAKYEEIARAIIDSIVSEGFYYKKHVLQTTGVGADYMPLWVDAKKILRVYENNILVYDAENESAYPVKYVITKDNTAIIVDHSGEINRSENSPIRIPIAPSDSDNFGYYYKTFHSTHDYIFILDAGYKKVPSDIQRAAELLVDDLACGRLDYYNRYVSSYNTDQFKISFDKQIFEGSGNIIVDKILSKYTKSIRNIGVL
jgi:hypothetical protein